MSREGEYAGSACRPKFPSRGGWVAGPAFVSPGLRDLLHEQAMTCGGHQPCTSALLASFVTHARGALDQPRAHRVLAPVAPGPYDCSEHAVGILAFRDQAASDFAPLHERPVVWPVHRDGPDRLAPSYALAGCATTRTAVNADAAPSVLRSALQARA
jgi:hypothetical protein